MLAAKSRFAKAVALNERPCCVERLADTALAPAPSCGRPGATASCTAHCKEESTMTMLADLLDPSRVAKGLPTPKAKTPNSSMIEKIG